MEDCELVLLERLTGGIAQITLNSPPLNLITTQMNRRLDAILDEVSQDSTIRVVVIAGAGDRAFSAGADIKEFSAFVRAGTMVFEKLRLECDVFTKLDALPQPTIAALHGITMGGGIELALCCDYRILGEQVKLAFPEIGLGLFPGSGGLVRLPRLVGRTKAKELMLFGDKISAKKALEFGLVNEVAPGAQVLARAIERAKQLAALPGTSLSAIKQGIDDICEMPVSQGIEYSLELMNQVLSTPDAQEGVNAFLERREPKFNRG